MQNFPLFLSLQGRRALVIGGNEPAVGRVELLLSVGAQVSVIADTVTGEIAQLIDEGRISWVGRTFEESDLAGVSLVIVSADDKAVQARVSQCAQAQGVPVNVLDRPTLSSFIMPAIVDRGPVTVAISTGGTAPALAGRLRAEIERAVPAAIGRLARFTEVFGAQVQRTLAEPRTRRLFWDRVFGGRIGELALAGDEFAARRELIRLLDSARGDRSPTQGMVHLVGAGPGDPDLLTLKAHRLLQRADVVLYDALVSPEVLAAARRDAERIGVRRPAQSDMSQEEINRRLIALARAGKSVVRLKGGDPLVFGRGGEEVGALLAAGIAVEVVPGITAALGCAASAGIPLTHPDHAQACVFVAGRTGDDVFSLDWPALARPRQTIVIYMDLEQLPAIVRQFVQHGLSPSTPVALIEGGTTDRERRAVGTLGTIERQSQRAELNGNTLCIVGEVVGLALAGDREIRFESRIGL